MDLSVPVRVFPVWDSDGAGGGEEFSWEARRSAGVDRKTQPACLYAAPAGADADPGVYLLIERLTFERADGNILDSHSVQYRSMSGYGGIGRRAGFRFLCPPDVWVRLPLSA